jgi:hypothetical protein
MRDLGLSMLATGVLACLATGCGDEEDLGPTVRVRFAYQGSTEPDLAVQRAHPQCADLVGETHIHPSWRNFRLFAFRQEGSRFALEFTDVPIDRELAVRVSDANVCDENPTGAATRGVYANNVRLERIVPTPGTGPEPGLSFSVDADGVVTP